MACMEAEGAAARVRCPVAAPRECALVSPPPPCPALVPPRRQRGQGAEGLPEVGPAANQAAAGTGTAAAAAAAADWRVESFVAARAAALFLSYTHLLPCYFPLPLYLSVVTCCLPLLRTSSGLRGAMQEAAPLRSKATGHRSQAPLPAARLPPGPCSQPSIHSAASECARCSLGYCILLLTVVAGAMVGRGRASRSHGLPPTAAARGRGSLGCPSLSHKLAFMHCLACLASLNQLRTP